MLELPRARLAPLVAKSPPPWDVAVLLEMRVELVLRELVAPRYTPAPLAAMFDSTRELDMVTLALDMACTPPPRLVAVFVSTTLLLSVSVVPLPVALRPAPDGAVFLLTHELDTETDAPRSRHTPPP
jgi:hypothetical protein